jgi:uncharacterized membrane protein
LKNLERELKNIPKSEIVKCLAYYNEIIEDYIEDGLREEAAVSRLDTPKVAAERFINERTITPIKESSYSKPNKSHTSLLFLILGFPLWFPLIVTFYSLVFTLFVVIWSLIFTIYVLFISFIISGIACIIYAPIQYFLITNLYLAIGTAGAGLILIGLSLIMLYFSKNCAHGLLKLSGYTLKMLKFTFFKKEDKINA